MSIGSWLKSLGSGIKHLFESHEDALQTVALDLQGAARLAASIATASGHGDAVPILNGIADGAGKLNDAVIAGAGAHTLGEGVAALTTLTSGLVNSGDLGIKNKETRNAIGAVVVKVGNVADVVNSAVEAQVVGAA